MFRAMSLLCRGNIEAAESGLSRSMELDPLSSAIQSFAGKTFTWARQYDAALAQFQRVNRFDPNFALNHERLAQLYALLGRYDEAAEEETNARVLSGEKPQEVVAKMTALRQAAASRGANGYWQTELLLSNEAEQPPEGYSRPFGLAMIYAHLGKNEEALSNLESAYNSRDTQMTELAVEPNFDAVRADPRFTDLERRVGLLRQ